MNPALTTRTEATTTTFTAHQKNHKYATTPVNPALTTTTEVTTTVVETDVPVPVGLCVGEYDGAPVTGLPVGAAVTGWTVGPDDGLLVGVADTEAGDSVGEITVTGADVGVWVGDKLGVKVTVAEEGASVSPSLVGAGVDGLGAFVPLGVGVSVGSDVGSWVGS